MQNILLRTDKELLRAFRAVSTLPTLSDNSIPTSSLCEESQTLRSISCLRRPKPGTQNPPGMPSHAANTYVTSAAFQSGAFQTDAFQVGSAVLEAQPDDIEFSGLALSVRDIWKKLFAQESW